MTVPISVLSRSQDDFTAELSILNKSDGSASWQFQQGTTVITSVNGPMEVRIRDEILGEATLELKVLPTSGLAGTQERYIENIVRSAIKPSLLLGLRPRSLVQITSQVVAHGESSLTVLDTIASAINSIVLASVDAGLSMNSMLAAAVIETADAGRHVVCYSFPKHELIMLESTGPFTRQQLPEVLESAFKQCCIVFESMKRKVEAKVEKDNLWKGQT